ncbi:hypothetical protein HaLaN_20060, partial [Haematococcus lacustris]
MNACGSLTVDPPATSFKPGYRSSQGDIWAETTRSSSYWHKVHANVPTSLQRTRCAGVGRACATGLSIVHPCSQCRAELKRVLRQWLYHGAVHGYNMELLCC